MPYNTFHSIVEITMTPVRRILLIVIALAFAGCATPTKTNIPYSGPIPQLDKIAQRNPLLATELHKLPEIQDGVSHSESSALKKIVELYDKFPDKFDKAFEQMYQVGKPDVRKYCSPLQTLFWLAEDGNTSLCNQIINEYSLRALLLSGWTSEESVGIHSKIIEADRLEKMCIDRALKEELFPYVLPEEVINEAIRYPEKFGMKEYKELSIVNKKLIKHKERWGDFDTVVDRLNAPELIDYYEKDNFTYDYYTSGRNHTPESSPKLIFKNKFGNCDAYSTFTTHCLKKAGYNASVEFLMTKGGYHFTSLFKSENKSYILDNAYFLYQSSGLKGPFKSVGEALNQFK